ncbi:MAG: hypothetical protein HQ546_00135 [Planctomycetes bacterium]|nr:hypothetical protein [Planctomycetota bacterium]
MTVPLGTSSEALARIARWSLRTTILAVPLTLWWPSIEGWAAFAAAVLTVWLCWFCWRMTSGRTEVPGHLIHLALVGILAVGSYHLIGSQLNPAAKIHRALCGEFNAALVVHVALIALVVMLAHDLLGRADTGSLAATVLGLVVISGSLTGLAVARPEQGRIMLAMLGWAGVAILCRPFWRLSAAQTTPGGHGVYKAHLAVECLRALAVLAAAVALSVACPPSVVLMTAALAATLVLGACCLPARRRWWAWGAVAAAVATGIQLWGLWPVRWPAWPSGGLGWLGRGEQAILELPVWDWSLSVLVGSVGWVGVLWFLAGLTGCLVWAMRHAREANAGDHARGLLTAVAAVVATTAMLTPGGFFNPAVNVVFAVTWALLPRAFGLRPINHSGWWLLAGIVGVSLMLGLASHRGLLMWMTAAVGRGEITLHVVVGALITLALLWLLHRRRWWALLAAGLSLVAGGIGELAQEVISTHQGEWIDAAGHAAGALAALILFILCRASRWSESPDARRKDPEY